LPRVTPVNGGYVKRNIEIKCPAEGSCAGRAGNRSLDRRRKTLLKRLVYLATAALVAMLILVPTAMAQEMTVMQEETMMMEKDLPKSGGVPVGSILLPAAALLVGGGVLGYAVLRRR
jgi:hypothetical protein